MPTYPTGNMIVPPDCNCKQEISKLKEQVDGLTEQLDSLYNEVHNINTEDE